MKKIVLLLLTPLLLPTFCITPAHAETVNCTEITSLPYTITTSGVYCLASHLSTSVTMGDAVTIAASNVVLDLNGFKIGGNAAGSGTKARGISAYQRQNITIKNGTVRGFYVGIWLSGSPRTSSQGHIIEDIRLDHNTVGGIRVEGMGNMVRNNQVVATGGSTESGTDAQAWGIMAAGPGMRLVNNDVTGVAAQNNGYAFGICLTASSNSIVVGNRISTVTSAGENSSGIYLSNSSDIIISDNRISGTHFGINFQDPSTGKYMNNMTQGVNTPYLNGTPAGTTNY